MMLRRFVCYLGLFLLSYPLFAAEYAGFRVKAYDPQQEHLNLYLKDENGQPFKTFERLTTWLTSKNEQLVFAMNAGMYQSNFEPVGLLVIQGKQLGKLNLRNAKGNFYWKPNGVFVVDETGAKIVESSDYFKLATKVQLATQSGPLLLQQGKIHPEFTPNAISRLIRNGVGIAGGQVYFVISTKPVNFYEFASFFKDELKCSDALYLDGVVSAIYAADTKFNNQTTPLGPLLGLTKKP